MTIGPGVFIPVVGPSGAGKDSLLAYAKLKLAGRADIHFVRRVITRPSWPDSEDHDTLDDAGFVKADADGAFALSWHSHGLSYGIPAEVDQIIRDGGIVVANLSRASVADAVRRYRNVTPVMVAVSPEILAKRLASRGRENSHDIAARIARNAQYEDFAADCHVVDNSGDLNDAGEAMIRMLEATAASNKAQVEYCERP